MGYKCLYGKIIIIVFYFLITKCSYSQDLQNPDGKLTFTLKDNCGKKIEFDQLKYTYNKGLIIYDKSNKYIIKIEGLKFNNTNSVTNLKVSNIDGISYFEVDVGWSSKIMVEINKKRSAKVDTMVVFFENIYEQSANTEIKFSKGDYTCQVKEIIESKKMKGEYLNNFIDPKFFKKNKM